MTDAPTTIRVVDLETTGTRGDGAVIEIGWQDVELTSDGMARLAEGPFAALIDPHRPITPSTSAIHHLIDEDVAGAPTFLDVAPAILRPARPITALASHRATFERSWCVDSLTGGLPWICTHKAALRAWPEAPTHSNQGLRYWRRPPGLDRAVATPAHRAGPDAYVTAHLLALMLCEHGIATLLAWSAEPALLARVPWGPERGVRFAELPTETLQRLAAGTGDISFSARHALSCWTSRKAIPSAAPDLFG